jgi:hypothetical protein
MEMLGGRPVAGDVELAERDGLLFHEVRTRTSGTSASEKP